MTAPGWLVTRAAELPAGEDWLSPRERKVLARLRYEKRRGDWLLGRWAAKRALAARLSASPKRLEVIAADDGVPEPFLDGAPAPATLSISHRGERALATVGPARTALGCDLELVEPRSGAFVREWLSPAERELVADAVPEREALVANLVWCAKEAAAKARRAGLRLNVRQAVVSLDHEHTGEDWSGLGVSLPEGGGETSGWWRTEPGWVMAVIAEPNGGPPQALK